MTDSTELAVREPTWAAPHVPLPISSHEDYVQVASELRLVKDFEKRVTLWFRPLKEKAHAAWKALVAREGETLAPARAWETECKRGLAVWDTEQERLRREEQRRLEAEARKQEEERRLAEAAALEAEGIAEGDESKLAEAVELIEEPIETPLVIVPKTTPKVAGISYREQWSVQVTDLHALIRYVALNPSHMNLLTPNTTALNGLARSLRSTLAIPGVKAIATKVVASR